VFLSGPAQDWDCVSALRLAERIRSPGHIDPPYRLSGRVRSQLGDAACGVCGAVCESVGGLRNGGSLHEIGESVCQRLTLSVFDKAGAGREVLIAWLMTW
jgi:hypothetical protein